ncbi:MAG TPA: radical SAM protein [Vicinamibacterales bacterium]|nr:radical SAM protein [Vicinamibacterales bacterium]
MKPSIFNLRAPIEGRRDVFLMNTLTDAQLVVSEDVAALLDRCDEMGDGASGEAREALDLLQEHGFIVEGRDADRRALDQYLADVKADTSELNVTVLTTLQCNFACDYCFQGDHGDYNLKAERMSMETAGRVADWIERELDRLDPGKLVLTFFGGEPLLNLPVLYALAERAWEAGQVRQVPVYLNIITNGLLLTPDVVDRLVPLGLNGVKITLDGDRDTHNRMRPLRGGQGTFDRIIKNVRAVAGKCRIGIGGNFDESSVDSFPALLQYLSEQEFADKLAKVNFKPIFRPDPNGEAAAANAQPKGYIPLKLVSPKETLNGTCMTSVGSGAGKACDSCNVLDDKMTFIRNETRRLGFPTQDGVHNGPCHVHKAHAHTIGPDGSLYPCPGFTGQLSMSTGHIDDRRDAWRETARDRFNRLDPWKDCGDCAFIPVCAGGCVAASYSQLGDMNAPTCHKRSFESALISLAQTVAGAA